MNTTLFIDPRYARQPMRDDRAPPAQTEITKDTGLAPLARYIRHELAKLRLEDGRGHR